MSTLVPVPGEDLRVGDVYLPKVDRRMKVERIMLVTRPGYPMNPMLIAQGATEMPPSKFSPEGYTASDWDETYWIDEFVVVER